MNTKFYYFLLLCSFTAMHAQKLRPVEVKEKTLTHLLGSISSFKQYPLSNQMVSIYTAGSSEGTHQTSETDEVTNDVYLASCEMGEGVDCKLYVLKGLMAVKIERVFEESGAVKVTLSYGNESARKSDTVNLPSK
ncbi:MAG: hypothetical protein CFE23_14875 [Flavobacterium sp. BFFFF1]|uniref:hypothetical protein n=1 Tax=Flavobacterium sp. BFFFF1 TaxID=2015557 RepID=UPI000BD0FE42|nr:hypothetical protein [Flavobacterium sp. BFFFF1]OYU79268.1 MAG: hypothetical protein CFE23_14875 [Flavobacterium sp. BFFFF1]